MSTVHMVSIEGTRRQRAVLSGLRVPEASELADLGPAERSRLLGLLQEPVEYVHHELFDKPSAELLIFGCKAELVPGVHQFRRTERDTRLLQGLSDGELLTAAQEILIFQRLNYARMCVAQLLIRYHEERAAGERLGELLAWHDRATAIRDALAQATLPLVPSMAAQARFRGLDFSDLISEGNCALLRAIMTFDCARGYRFSTYGCRAILKSFARVILRATRYRNRFPMEFDPAREHGDPVEVQRDEHWTACVHELAVMLSQNRAKLSQVEETVIRERFALNAADDSGTPKTLDEVGEMIGVTKERVRQIQMKALKKLRRDMEKNFLVA